ncbi:hypothetical protein [Burkholderia cepacia]|uniref:hypothetical protein n=2 Tax=Burkholderia cepacia TaxID=292 RepID=UPI001E578514|nr:hypothetical protein [Burkholderia cepacia]
MGIHHPTFEASSKATSLTFQSEEEGDAYVARLEQLLDAGIVPADVVEQREMISTTLDAIREYLRRVSVPDSDNQVLNTLLGRLPSNALTTVDYEWAERWVTGMKREQHLSPSTIRHNVGALARCFDWVVKSGTPMLAVNPLRLLPKRYATYTVDGSVYETVRRQLRGVKRISFQERIAKTLHILYRVTG